MKPNPTCRFCDIPLTNHNWTPYCQKVGLYRCETHFKKMKSESNKKYYKAHKAVKTRLQPQEQTRCRVCDVPLVRGENWAPNLIGNVCRTDANAYAKAYYEANKEKCKTKTKTWQANNPDKVKEAAAKWAKENPEKIKAQRRRSAKTLRTNRPEEFAEYMALWRKNNAEKVKEYQRKAYLKRKAKALGEQP